VNFTFKKRSESQATPESESERRRVGMIVRDDLGNACVDWRDAPAGLERPVLEILGESSLAVKVEEPSYDPYARGRAPRATSKAPGGTARTDLRRLSEHIKLMRALEERRRSGDEED
jgi:hypothetical protein